ncbi:hypothetical protein LTR94_031619, partial [Friedmanniomyces endolithicus]
VEHEGVPAPEMQPEEVGHGPASGAIDQSAHSAGRGDRQRRALPALRAVGPHDEAEGQDRREADQEGAPDLAIRGEQAKRHALVEGQAQRDEGQEVARRPIGFERSPRPCLGSQV